MFSEVVFLWECHEQLWHQMRSQTHGVTMRVCPSKILRSPEIHQCSEMANVESEVFGTWLISGHFGIRESLN